MTTDAVGLQRDIRRMMQSLRESGLNEACLTSASESYQRAYAQLTETPTLQTGKTWLRACIVYQAYLVKESAWAQLAKFPSNVGSKLELKDRESLRLYALMLTNSAMASYKADESSARVARFAESAVDAFETLSDALLNRWWGCALALLAHTKPMISPTLATKEKAKEHITRALGLFKKPCLPSLSAFVFAQYVAGIGDGCVPGMAGTGQFDPFEASDFFWFQAR